MKRMIGLFALMSALVPAVTHASSPAAAYYVPGWNMVGAPAGTDFSAAAALFTYQDGTYVAPATRSAVLCGGYWAYFTSNAAVSLASADTSASETCALQAGWTMVGDPFGVPATVPAGTVAWYWDAPAGQYQTVSEIPVGGAVWIYSASAGSVTLTNPTVPPPTPTVVINTLALQPSYQVHVGQQVEVVVPTANPSTVSVDATYLHPVSAGITGDVSCASGTASCAPGTFYQFWLYTAVAAGNTIVTVNPLCRQATPPCAAPSQGVALAILP